MKYSVKYFKEKEPTKYGYLTSNLKANMTPQYFSLKMARYLAKEDNKLCPNWKKKIEI